MDTSSNQLQASSPESPPNSPCFPFPKGKQKRKAGRKKFQETRHPVYNGVRRRNGKWVCELRQPHTKSRIWLGTFSCPQMAARAHDVAALALKGESAPLNFPETVHLLPRAKSSSIKDIQIAALEAAEDHSNINNTGGISSFNHAEEKTRVGEETSNRKMFLDEEELFNMPALLDAMAEGLILTPPALKRGFSWDGYIENDTAMDLTLWSD